MRYLLVLISLFVPTASWAVDGFSPQDFTIGSMIASLLLVLVCIFVFAFLVKKSNLIQQGKGTTLIKVVATQVLSNKGRVQIIEVNEKRYLLGVTEQNISLLDTLEIPEQELENLQSTENVTPFSALLSKISHKRNE